MEHVIKAQIHEETHLNVKGVKCSIQEFNNQIAFYPFVQQFFTNQRNPQDVKCDFTQHSYIQVTIHARSRKTSLLEEMEWETAFQPTNLNVNISCLRGIAGSNWGCKVTERGDCKSSSEICRVVDLLDNPNKVGQHLCFCVCVCASVSVCT